MCCLPALTSPSAAAPVGTVNNNGDGTLTVTGANWGADSRNLFRWAAFQHHVAGRKLPGNRNRHSSGRGQRVKTPLSRCLTRMAKTPSSCSPLRRCASAIARPRRPPLPPFFHRRCRRAQRPPSRSIPPVLNFGNGQIAVGFGTSDITVRRVFVAGPNRLLVNVSVAGGAALSSPQVSIFAVFQLATQPSAFQITPAVPGQPQGNSDAAESDPPT